MWTYLNSLGQTYQPRAHQLLCVCTRLGYRAVRSARVFGDPGRGGRSWRALEMAGYSVVVIFTDAGGRVKYYV
jgi:hypothetical protein